MSHRAARTGAVVTVAVIAGVLCASLGAGLLTLLLGALGAGGAGCSTGAGGAASEHPLGPGGTRQQVGAVEDVGPGYPSSGATGARGDNLLAHPGSYAELGGLSWQTATAIGGLSYMAPLRISWGAHSAIA